MVNEFGKFFAGFVVGGVGDGEEAVKETHFGLDGVRCGNPVKCSFDSSSGGSTASF